MLPGRFDYREATSVEEAVDLLAGHADREARVLAGGQGLVPEMKAGSASPGVLVDVGGVEALRGVDVGDEATTVGALVTHADLAASDALAAHAPVLPRAAAAVGDPLVRRRGTLGGNLVQADPAADLPAAAVAADASVVVRGPERRRTVPAGAFFLGPGETDAAGDELVTGVRVPHADGAGAAYARRTHPVSGFAMVGVAAVARVEGGAVTDARVAATGVCERPVRLSAVEAAVAGADPADGDALAAAADRAADGLDPAELVTDVRASGEFRAELLRVYARRALAAAVDRAAPGKGGDDR